MAIRALLNAGDVLVVDAKDALANVVVGVVEQRQYRVGESQFLVDAVFGELTNPRLDVVGGRTGQIVVLHQHRAEIADHHGLAGPAQQVRAVLVPDPRRLLLEVVRELLVEDVSATEMWLSAENTSVSGDRPVSKSAARP